MEIVWFEFLISTLLFLLLGLTACEVVRRVTKINCKKRPIILADERTRLIKYIICLLLPIWIFYEFYLFHWSSISWVGELFTNFFTVTIVLFVQEMKRLDNKDCGLWLYALIGIILLVISNYSNDVTTAYKNYGVPMGVSLLVWVGHECLKNCLGIGNCYTARLKRLFRREKTKKLQEENKNENIIN
ncbi:hypothetical protein SAMN02745671_01655 [Anaerovibrio lipolyticus DSM 3074]|uniref:Uncharacterized protein n=1 Tax=Anaerovibrio lipolyticus DSM 3074 TaxID=1120997 RepID=A0A1M6DYR3_9FIRM|nr:hypothetical protein SAMN02745671_01655 [Anaerovibrio lipolyticus DSM 3074]